MCSLKHDDLGNNLSELILSVNCPDSLYSIMPFADNHTVIFAEAALTKLDFEQATEDWGLEKEDSVWLMYANPGIGPSQQLNLMKIDRMTLLKGYQSIGQSTTEGYGEIAKVPFWFVHIKGNHGINFVFQVWFDPMASEVIDRIIRSVHIIE